MVDLKSLPVPDILRRLVTFIGVGAVNTVIGLSVILFLSEILHVHYMLANAIGYGLGIMLSFLMHRNITFRDVSHMSGIGAQFGKFTAIFSVAYSLQLGGLFVMVHMLRWPNWFSQVVACGLYVVISFLGSRFIAFRASSEPEKSS